MQLTNAQLAFIRDQRVARLATSDRANQPHVVPVCYACTETCFYIALDTKPKRVAPARLKRVRNILENPRVALIIDHYSEDWSELAYVLIQGTAGLLPPGSAEHRAAIALLRAKYPPYQAMPIHEQPVIAIRPAAAAAWGALPGR